MAKSSLFYVICLFVTLAWLETNGIVVAPPRKTNSHLSDMGCDVCAHSVALCTSNYDSSYSNIKQQMKIFCLKYGDYAFACLSFVEIDLKEIYTDAHNPNIYPSKVCLRLGLCNGPTNAWGLGLN
uniref:Saposin B-type domain-containing protein n=1 Tax=Rhabditophanes sp. KR3021 TaxID=114890 RepID=A0AC35U990_9BILA